jgi:probable rRNA maturation factor
MFSKAGEIVIVLTDDARMRRLNRKWRGQDRPTNVLSFPVNTRHAGNGKRCLLGDIVIAYETTTREARAEEKAFDHHMAHLAVHGFLHLMGYDHETDEEALVMERLETSILARLNIPDPYSEREAPR